VASLRQNAFVVIVLTALTAIVGAWSGIAGAERLWYLPAGLLLLALAYERIVARRAAVRLRVRTAARWRLAEAAPVVLEFGHSGRRALELEVAVDAPAGVECARDVSVLRLDPGAPRRVELRAIARRLGPLAWPALRGRIGGPLGLAWWPLRLADHATLRVEPGMLGARGGLAGAAPGGERSSARRGAGGEILQLRAYQPGDAFRSIDWKATARTGRLTARDFIEDQQLELVIGVDAGRSSAVWCGDLDRLGHYVNLAARLAERAIAHGDRVGIVVYGDRPLAALRPERGAAAVRRVRTLLGALEPQTTDSNPIHAVARIRALVRRRCLVILLTEIDDAATGSQLASAVRLLVPQHMLLIAALMSAAADSPAHGAASDWRDPFRALAIAETRLRRGRSLAALHALGAAALVARPEVVESVVFDAYDRFRRERRV
jgi:uncharacterized protein (DUF58 family)